MSWLPRRSPARRLAAHRVAIMSPEDCARARELLVTERRAHLEWVESTKYMRVPAHDLRHLPGTLINVPAMAGFVPPQSGSDSSIRVMIEHDEGAELPVLSVHVGDTKAGEVSIAKARRYAPLLDDLTEMTFLVDGDVDPSGRVSILMPTLPALRNHVRASIRAVDTPYPASAVA